MTLRYIGVTLQHTGVTLRYIDVTLCYISVTLLYISVIICLSTLHLCHSALHLCHISAIQRYNSVTLRSTLHVCIESVEMGPSTEEKEGESAWPTSGRREAELQQLADSVRLDFLHEKVDDGRGVGVDEGLALRAEDVGHQIAHLVQSTLHGRLMWTQPNASVTPML